MKTYDKNKPLKGPCRITDKLNGVNARWTGEKFLSRGGHEITSIPHLVRAWTGKAPTEGEIYNHSFEFNQINGAVNRILPTEDSLQLEFFPFNELEAIVVDSPTTEQLQCLMADALDRGFEGIVIESLDQNELYKLKPTYDAEFAFVGFNPSKSPKHANTFGSLRLQTSEGHLFNCSGLAEDQRRELWAKPPTPGTPIKVAYGEISSKGIPQFPRFVCIRWDLDKGPQGGNRYVNANIRQW